MKYMVVSDIHGNIKNLEKIFNIYKQECCSKLIVLGDLFSYQYNNDDYEIIEMLNRIKDDLYYVKGNCDENLNSAIFETPLIKEINFNNQKLFLTHGHLFTKEELLEEDCNIVLTGHSHIASIQQLNDKLFINPGSISKSRKGENSFIIIDNELITIRNLNNEIIKEYKI